MGTITDPPVLAALLDGVVARHEFGPGAIAYRQSIKWPTNPDESLVMHYARQSPAALRYYFNQGSAAIKVQSAHWVAYMYQLTGSAVSEDRYPRANGEYTYALARHVGQLLEMNALAGNQNGQSLAQQCTALLARMPDMGQAFAKARQGRPAELHHLGDALLEQAFPGAECYGPRFGLIDDRRNPSILSL